MRKVQTAALTAASLLVFGGYYSLGDALDLLPGPVTVAYADVAPRPFPTPVGPSVKTAAAPSGLDQGAPTPSKTALSGYAQGVASDAALTGGNVTASVVDVATGEELLDRSAATGVTPASTNKVLTAWAALSSMGPGHTLQTKAVLEGQTLTLVGGGDVLLAENEGDPSVTAGHAGLGDLARATAEKLKSQGTTSVSLRLDDTLFTGAQWNEKWEAGNEQYVAKIQPIMVDVSATQNQGYPEDPAMGAAQVFAKHLSEAGITVDGEPTRAAASGGAREMASVSSAPLSDILALSLKTSDNTMTEVEGRLVAAHAKETADFAGASKAVLAQLGKDGFDTSGVTLLDSSGLAKGNKVPARLLAQILAKAAGGEGGSAGRTLIADLPVAALDGTLDHRLHDTAAAGTVRAKTGSLEQTSSLAGVVTTADGRQLAFAVMANGFPANGGGAAATAIDNHFVAPLASCGCS
ncbi:D-alanyl-D-alanine carboxypeptidase [Actinomyces sp. HMSC075C01]|uniref:D-alanyl-D-alanine carboxypeptidase/D-alanyl-D-alanine-endopeptidase n=1 Tax=Actinomyces oris TaxID=544580 RepID=A0A1Q8VUB2_9ACTO|nr:MULTISPECIES: D-alanyl-D-alanine carboxypeptidase/D-alanyl-D-alanine-endopeptidase [Actinomyces]OFR49320.1 D-alanyl-D-alanine carboxypeptidase [Actinomyces sp. HMSC075C01]OLO51697.1 D-alanyl-D-alanine carboxypeptidase/D-alanyl-D-alanine-endopeptidase [Actinomyces oris]